MVYKKYIKRGNKLHGPYYYESYRDENGKIRKRYVGTSLPEKKDVGMNKLVIGLFVFLLVAVFVASSFLKPDVFRFGGSVDDENYLDRLLNRESTLFAPGDCDNLICDGGETAESCPMDCRLDFTKEVKLQYPTYLVQSVLHYKADGSVETVSDSGLVKDFLAEKLDVSISGEISGGSNIADAGGLVDFDGALLDYGIISSINERAGEPFWESVKDNEDIFLHAEGFPATEANRLALTCSRAVSDEYTYFTYPSLEWRTEYTNWFKARGDSNSRLDGLFMDNGWATIPTSGRYIRRVANESHSMLAGQDVITVGFTMHTPGTFGWDCENTIVVRDEFGVELPISGYTENTITLASELTADGDVFVSYEALAEAVSTAVDDYDSDMLLMLDNLRQTFGNKLLVYNGILENNAADDDFLNYVDGGMEENWASDTNDQSKWFDQVDEMESFSSQDKLFLAQTFDKMGPDTKNAMFSFASYLLGKGETSYYDYTDSVNSYQNYVYFDYYDEYFGASLANFDTFHSFGGGNIVYGEEFENALVLVNPSSSDSDGVSIDEEDYSYYWDRDGVLQTVVPSNLIIEGKSAVILMKDNVSVGGCGDGICSVDEDINSCAVDCDCTGGSFEGCEIPNFGKMKSAWIQANRGEVQWDEALTYGINTIVTKYNAFGFVDTNAIEEFAGYANQKNVVFFPAFNFRHVAAGSPVTTEAGVYYKQETSEMVDSIFVPPLSRAYWTDITDSIKQIAQMGVDDPTLRIDGVKFDFELYDPGRDETSWYFTYDGNYDDETFSEFVIVNGLTGDIPLDNARRFERYDYLDANGYVDDYYDFVSAKAQELAEELKREVYAIDPTFIIGEYQSPTPWSIPNNRYTKALYLDFLKGWSLYSAPVIFGTDMYGGGGLENMPIELTKQPEGYYLFDRRDGRESIPVYYVPGFLLRTHPPSTFDTIFEVAEETNGYWLFSFLPLQDPYTCFNLPNQYYRISVNCAAEDSGTAPNCCYEPYDLVPQSTWETQCCPHWDEGVQSYWDAISELNLNLDEGSVCGNNICEIGENTVSCAVDCEQTNMLTYWGVWTSSVSDWDEYKTVATQLRDIGFSHAAVKVGATNPSQTTRDLVSLRAQELRDLGLDLSIHMSPGHRLLMESDQLDPENHSLPVQQDPAVNLKYFDSINFNPYVCDHDPDMNCAVEPSRAALDPAYDGVIWQNELDFVTRDLGITNLTGDDVVVIDAEVWGPYGLYGQNYVYPDVLANSVTRYVGNSNEELENEWYDYRLQRGWDIKSRVKAFNESAGVFFYGENIPSRSYARTVGGAVSQQYNRSYITAGTGDVYSREFYHAPNLTFMQEILDSDDYSGVYAWVSFSLARSEWTDLDGTGWSYVRWDPNVTQKMGYLLFEEGIDSAVEYPGPFAGLENTTYYLEHAAAFVSGLQGNDPGVLEEICLDEMDNDGDGQWDELGCVEVCGNNFCEPGETPESCSLDCSRVLTTWGNYIDGVTLDDNADWQGYLNANIALKDLGFTHAAVRIVSSTYKPYTSTRLAEMRSNGLNLTLIHNPGHQILVKDIYPDGDVHASNGEDLKYFDTPGFDPNVCDGNYRNGWCERDIGGGISTGVNCVDNAAWTAHDPAYDGAVWQDELALMDDILSISGITENDIIDYDMEVWGELVADYEGCYPGVIENSASRYSGNLSERYDQYRGYWLDRAQDLADLGEGYNDPLTLFYNDEIAENQEAMSVPRGAGDYPSPVMYALPSLSTLQWYLDQGDYSNTYIRINVLSSSSAGWGFHHWDPKITQKAGYMIRQEGALGIITYPGPIDRDVDLFLDHAEALSLGFMGGIDPGVLEEICSDGLDNDGDAEVDEAGCVELMMCNNNGICDAGEDYVSCSADCLQSTIDLKLAESDSNGLVRDFLMLQNDSLVYQNGGNDYAPVLNSLISTLPAGGGVITVPTGKYVISSPVVINNDNVVLQAGNFGDVILEARGVGDHLIKAEYFDNVTIENLILWGGKEEDSAAVLMRATNSEFKNNAIINFDWAYFLTGSSTYTPENVLISGNYFFDNGYHTLRLGGERNESLDCHRMVRDITVRDNYLSSNYQGITSLCSFDSLIENNTVWNSSIAGLRIETSNDTLVRGNVFHENGLSGVWLYAITYGTILERNFVLDNNQNDQPFYYDCATAQQTLADSYLYDRSGPTSYPYLREENGNPIFSFHWCQFNGEEIELRNEVSEGIFVENVIGRYQNLAAESPLDVRVGYYPLKYNSDLQKLSNDNVFDGNYFINSSQERFLDEGCGTSYFGNQLVNFGPFNESDFDILSDGNILCSTSDPCDSDGVCEPLQGERNYNCAADCPLVGLNETGSRFDFDLCQTGLNLTEPIFPAIGSCVNVYDGTFTCTECGNGICGIGEGVCSCPSDCSCAVADLNSDGSVNVLDLVFAVSNSYDFNGDSSFNVLDLIGVTGFMNGC